MDEKASEGFGSIPNSSATFGTVPRDAETIRSIRNEAERTEQHTLTVREVARLFEQAGVPRTERSIINWCQQNRQGIARLDAFFDTNERKYFITQQSVSLAIKEERAKQPSSVGSAEMQTPPRTAPQEMKHGSEDEIRDSENIRDMRRKITDLEITNRVKEQFVEMLQQERERLVGERDGYVRELMVKSHRIGELETQVLQLGDGGIRNAEIIPQHSETVKVRDDFVRHDVTSER